MPTSGNKKSIMQQLWIISLYTGTYNRQLSLFHLTSGDWLRLKVNLQIIYEIYNDVRVLVSFPYFPEGFALFTSSTHLMFM